jgi:glutamyl-tRNA(Gln) amidotransferase subunit E
MSFKRCPIRGYPPRIKAGASNTGQLYYRKTVIRIERMGDEPDYRKLGLRVGFEIHQELDTHKLFCSCPSKLREEEPPMSVKRRLRPTQSEMGEVDRAAMAEAIKGKSFLYQTHPDTVCLVELDEEPPHPINDEALDTALEISLLLGAKPVDEAHTMRKIVIDGSNTCGFQRTVLVATDGEVEVEGRRVRIPTVCLEEDAARKMDENTENVEYRLDRLGIPLVEIATAPDFSDPYTPARAALHIGQLLRATGRVKRGIGTIRQDINISIGGGSRQEIKGVQELGLISKVIELEVRRQLALLGIRDELKRRGAGPVEEKFMDVTEVFSKTGSKIIRRALEAGGKVLAVRLPKFAGLIGRELQPGRRFGTELADHARLYGRVGGIFHSDELPGYGISEEETAEMRRAVGAEEGDAVVFAAGEVERAKAGLQAVLRRVNQALQGVPEETRRALPDGTTEHSRPLPGAARMYPETDIPPVAISPDRIEKIRKRLPERPEEKVRRYVEEYHLSGDLARKMAGSTRAGLFEEIVRIYNVEPALVAVTLEETLKSLRREKVPTDNLQDNHVRQVFELLSEGVFSREALPAVLTALAKNPAMSARSAAESLSLTRLSPREVEKIVRKVVQSNPEIIKKLGERAFKPLMGQVMKEVRGRAGGEAVGRALEKAIREFLRS